MPDAVCKRCGSAGVWCSAGRYANLCGRCKTRLMAIRDALRADCWQAGDDLCYWLAVGVEEGSLRLSRDRDGDLCLQVALLDGSWETPDA